MLILFSGIGDDAQNQLAVGVGALAGSTIMLLTIPWCLSVYGGRVDLDATGNANYRKNPKLSPDNA
ncbi:NCL [Symbiodinium microadriaticum]|nr:NCL [Symbiodinium microadriaticum]